MTYVRSSPPAPHDRAAPFRSTFDSDKLRPQLAQIDKQAADPNLWSNPERSQQVMREKKRLDGMIATDADLRRYFEPLLVALISKDEKDAARRRDVPTLDGDPFIDAQDWETPSFDITVSDAGNGKATATVKFVNAGQPVTVALDLIAVGGTWRIHDITWQHDGKPETLRGLFKH